MNQLDFPLNALTTNTYYDNSRPRQYFPDFVVVVRDAAGNEKFWIAETKGEMRLTTTLKREAAELWCDKMSGSRYGNWRYLLVPQRPFEHEVISGTRSFMDLCSKLLTVGGVPEAWT